jgi:tetratricopeptide (TPR) repeat protein
MTADPRSLVRNARALIRSGGPDHPHRRGMENAAQGNYDEAIASFREAIAAVPDAPWSYIALADLLAETGAGVEAADAYRRALERIPANAVAMRESIAMGLSRVGEFDTAIAEFRIVLAEEPARSASAVGLARALLGLADQMRIEAAHLLVDTEDLGEDEQLISAAIEAAPRVPGLYRRLAQSLAHRGDRTRAITVVQLGLAHDPDDPATLALLAELLATQDLDREVLPLGQRERLLDLVERAAVAHPNDADLLVQCARLATRHGSAEKAAAAWQKVVEREPDVAVWHRELGDRLAEAGDFEAAGAAYDRAVALGYEVY